MLIIYQKLYFECYPENSFGIMVRGVCYDFAQIAMACLFKLVFYNYLIVCVCLNRQNVGTE